MARFLNIGKQIKYTRNIPKTTALCKPHPTPTHKCAKPL